MKMYKQVNLGIGGTQPHAQTNSQQEMIEMVTPTIQPKSPRRPYRDQRLNMQHNIVSPNVPYGCMPVRNAG